MKIIGVLLAFVGFALGIYEMINTLRGKENKRILCGVAIAYLGYGVCYSVSQKDLGYIGVAFLFGLIFYAIRVMCVLLRMAAKREKRSLKNDLIVLAVLLVGFIAGMMLPYDKEEEAKRIAESQQTEEETIAKSDAIEKSSSLIVSSTDESKEIKSFFEAEQRSDRNIC